MKHRLYNRFPPLPFESQRNHQAKNRAPPQNGGGADKQREFGEILGDIKNGLEWSEMV
jgi:hypothetical protein